MQYSMKSIRCNTGVIMQAVQTRTQLLLRWPRSAAPVELSLSSGGGGVINLRNCLPHFLSTLFLSIMTVAEN